MFLRFVPSYHSKCDRLTISESADSKEKTEVLYGAENAVDRGVRFMKNTREKMDIYFDKKGPSIVIEVKAYRDGYRGIRKRGGRIRALTEVTADNIHYCKALIGMVDELHHIEGIRGGLAINEREYMSATILEGGKPLTQVIYSNVKALTEHEQYIFDTLWNNSIPAEQRIKEIEEGTKPEFIETLRDSDKVLKLVFDLIMSARDEILIMLSTANAFHRQERAGTISRIAELAERLHLEVRILTPIDDRIALAMEEMKKRNTGILFHHLEPSLQGKISILIVDRKYLLAVELRDDSKKSSLDAIGLATYSNSKATVLSYVSIFDSMWIQNELYERLKMKDKAQKEFINIAAHELRSPIQPILGLSEALHMSATNERQHELIDIIIRNGKRLLQLSENLLDLTRIEDNLLVLKKERFNLNEVIDTALQDARNSAVNKDKVRLIFQPSSEYGNKGIFVNGDRERITQTLCNLLNNAIKFTSTVILVTMKSGENNQFVIVSVKDDGCGIHASVLPRMFQKFTTKSEKGIGLGLFIARSIVEAHGGRIWARNNEDGKGATVEFSLPSTN